MLWLTALWGNPWVRKFAIYAAVSLAIFYGLRLWGNRQWAAGEQKGRVSATLELEEQYRAGWEAKQRQLAADSEQLAREQEVLQRQAAIVERARADLSREFRSTLDRISKYHEATNVQVDAVPDSELDAAIRAQSTKLAAPGH